MSANNVVWCAKYKGSWHVFYSGCMDNTPAEPDYKDKRYSEFKYRSNALLYAHDVVDDINKESLKEGFVGVEYGVCEITIKDKDKIDIQDFVNHVEEMLKRLDTQLITKENRIKERLCVLEDEAKHTKNDVPERCKKCKALTDEGYCSSPTMCVKIYPFLAKHKDGCYQFTYCNECMAYPMGLGCPNIVKGPVQLKMV
ncbi:hypothetical protein LCGC14_1772830 [marine sediment metagenome]|uniref:Uncharacterized protein n=1 Tax=marine sediment metagenome TaxID=412755 RepID=A0A0F9GXR3_9ZZZZ